MAEKKSDKKSLSDLAQLTQEAPAAAPVEAEAEAQAPAEEAAAPAAPLPVEAAPLREQQLYFARPTLRLVINQPFDIADRRGQYDVVATVVGGGLSGQAGAVKHGISQALTRYEPALRAVVKQAGFLTRDSRAVERKKYGRAKARRSFQFSKR